MALPDARTTPFDAYRLYMAVKLHLTSESYDAVKYQFKLGSAKRATFDAHKHRFFFERAARNYPIQSDCILFYAFNFQAGKKYITEFTRDAVIEKQAYLQSHSYRAKDELIKLAELSGGNLDSILVAKDGNPPRIFSALDDGIISMETLICINILTDFIRDSLRNGAVADPLGMYAERTREVLKLTPFITSLLPTKKIREILISLFTSSPS